MQERLRHEEEVEVNNGVWWQAALSVVPADDSAASSKGIKRALDKVRPLNPVDTFFHKQLFSLFFPQRPSCSMAGLKIHVSSLGCAC